jgi:cytosolic carboxypeptidase protein 2/3
MKPYTPFKQYISEYTLVVPNDNTLKFDSKFESGNLHKAIKISENEYSLLLDYDTETKGHTQWYYFSVSNYKKQHTVMFNIINLMKYESLYNQGMKPLVYSLQKFQTNNIGWHRDGDRISYYQNSLPRKFFLPGCSGEYYYTLTFEYTFEHINDLVYFAHCYPYTYTDLSSYLNTLSSHYSNYLRINTLCKTLGGNPCYIITITEGIQTYCEESNDFKKVRGSKKAMKSKELEIFKFKLNDIDCKD